MKIFIVHASCGKGHQIAAEALYEYLSVNNRGGETRILDILDYTDYFFKVIFARGYYLLASYFPYLWKILYSASKNCHIRYFASFLSCINCRGFIKLMLSERPDVILSTHFLPSEVTGYLKKKLRLNSRLLTVITDFGVHPYWITDNTDDYIVATEYTKRMLLAYRVKEDKIHAFGIPVKAGFVDKYEKKNSDLNLLLSTGSFGFSFIERIVRLICLKCNLTVVCGNNRSLFNRLIGKKYHNVKVYGFTNRMALLMSQSDCIITKPGGLSIAEALAVGLPMFFIDGIPGQETENAGILTQYGCAVKISSNSELVKKIEEIKNDKSLLDFMRKNIEKIKKPNSTEEICKYVCSSGIRASG